MVTSRWHPCCWSNRSYELIFSMSQLLQTPSDILSFRGVCKKWRKHSISLPPNILNPLLPHLIPTFNSDTLVIAACSIYQLTPKSSADTNNSEIQASWMVMAEEVNPGKIQLRHPITGRLLNYSATTLDFTHFKVFEVSKGYSLQHTKLSVMKVLLHSDSASRRLSSVNDCTAFVLHDSGTVGAFRVSKCNWNTLGCSFDDIVNFKGMVGVVNSYGSLFEMGFEIKRRSPLLLENVLAADLVCSNSGNRRKTVSNGSIF